MTSLGVNAERHRDHNRRLVLQALRRHGRMSRADLTHLTLLSPQAISNIVAELLQDGLLRELGRRRGARGQPPIGLALDPDGALALGIDIAPGGLTAVLTDLLGAELGRASVALPKADPASVARALPQLLALLLAEAARRRRPVLGVGVVMPASFPGPGRPTELPGWASVADPAGLLADALGGGVKVLVEHDAAAAAIAAQLNGVARSASRVACLFLGRGIGLGLVLEGRVYRGATGSAGEIGHLPIGADGPACFCGQTGCLEQSLSAHAALRELGLADEAALETAPPGLAAWLDRAAPLLGRAVLAVENLFDPDLVVLAGRSDALVAGLAQRSMTLPPSLNRRPAPRLLQGSSGPFCAAHAAASLPLYERTTAAPARPPSSFQASSSSEPLSIPRASVPSTRQPVAAAR